MRANSEQANISLRAKSSAELKPFFGFSEALFLLRVLQCATGLKQSAEESALAPSKIAQEAEIAFQIYAPWAFC
ncbi:hypothetical protein [Staphylococcus sp. 11262D007BW]